MWPRLLVWICALTASACASQPAAVNEPFATRDVKLRHNPAAPYGAHYDRDTGHCSPGAAQLLGKEEFDALRRGWVGRAGAASCSDTKMQQIPSTTGYPEAFARLKTSGSAQVLVRLEADGQVGSVHPVCATDSAFAQAAVETARRIAYSPRLCDGVPVRSVILLPFNYGWKK